MANCRSLMANGVWQRATQRSTDQAIRDTLWRWCPTDDRYIHARGERFPIATASQTGVDVGIANGEAKTVRSGCCKESAIFPRAAARVGGAGAARSDGEVALPAGVK